MEENLLIVHGGGPTAVINASLYGAVREARRHAKVKHIYAAKNGTGGLLREELIDLGEIEEERLRLLLQTPGSAIGTSRDEIEEEDYDRMVKILLRKKIRYVLFNGGNGTMDSCGKLYKAASQKNADLFVMGIPKTMDNDIAITDHSPGFGSAALYIAQSVKELCMDVRSLPIHAVVLEACGRNAGWITAASALAEDGEGLGPDLIYLPETVFRQDDFLESVQRKIEEKKGIVIVVGEGLRDEEGNNIVKPIFETQRAKYFGDVSTHLALLIIKELGYKARGEKPGLLGRASVALQSCIDRDEAVLAGELACRAVLEKESGKMLAFRRISSSPYHCETFFADIDEVMLHEKKMPKEFINLQKNGVSEEFKTWCRPLLGRELSRMLYLNEEIRRR
ncbi:MAG: diphosphate--fructose-6-phosphate 1-phosphotransferase [Johnsonella sp.]|nr:diphosphate--fructose-6-phosphate 1-phosphotransferase [Johnsonella sp.]